MRRWDSLVRAATKVQGGFTYGFISLLCRPGCAPKNGQLLRHGCARRGGTAGQSGSPPGGFDGVGAESSRGLVRRSGSDDLQSLDLAFEAVRGPASDGTTSPAEGDQ